MNSLTVANAPTGKFFIDQFRNIMLIMLLVVAVVSGTLEILESLEEKRPALSQRCNRNSIGGDSQRHFGLRPRISCRRGPSSPEKYGSPQGARPPRRKGHGN